MFIETKWNDKELTILGRTPKWENAKENIAPKRGGCCYCGRKITELDELGIVYHRQIINNMPKIVCTTCEDARKKAEYSHGSGNVRGVEYTITINNCKKSDIEYLVGEGFGRMGKSARKYGADFSSLQKPSKNLHELFDNRGCKGGIVVTIRKNGEIVQEIKFKYGNGHTITELISILQTI